MCSEVVPSTRAIYRAGKTQCWFSIPFGMSSEVNVDGTRGGKVYDVKCGGRDVILKKGVKEKRQWQA